MITFTNTIHINRPVADVYAYLSDLEHLPAWNWAITKTTKITPGPIGVGTQYRQTRSTPQPANETLEITGLDVDRQIAIEGSLAELPSQISYELNEVENGTALTNTVNLRPHGALRLAAPVIGPRIKHAVAGNLNELKARLERR